MSGGREARLAVALIGLGVVAVLLVATSPRGAPPREDRLGETAASTTPSAQTSPALYPVEARGLDGAARKVATHWATAYTSWKPNEHWGARLARLRPYSTSGLITEMRVNSGALELEHGDSRRVGEVVATQAQDSTEGEALMVLVEQTTPEHGRRDTRLISVTLELVPRGEGWRVAEVLVP